MYRYAFQGFDKEKMARAVGIDLPISMKNATMVCDAIRGKKVDRAKKILNDAIDLRVAIKFTRYNRDRGHKPGMGPAKYPVNTCKEILAILDNAEANAHQKNLGTELSIKHACTHIASRPFKYGRKKRQRTKRSHVEIVLEETKEEKTEK
jgi:large subunit ribosomal protein L22